MFKFWPFFQGLRYIAKPSRVKEGFYIIWDRKKNRVYERKYFRTLRAIRYYIAKRPHLKDNTDTKEIE